MANPAGTVSGIRVRHFAMSDRPAVRAIALSTAMMGNPAGYFFEGEEFLADALTRYFTDHEPGSSFVAVKDGRVVGYIVGTLNSRTMDLFFQRNLLFPLAGKVISQGLLLRRKNMMLLFQVLKAAVTGRLIVPDFSREYPATLHINLLADARGSGAGGMLMDAYLDLLRENRANGVRLATMSEEAGRFFESKGFKLLFRSSRPYFRHILGHDVPLLVYGRRLP